MADTLKINYFTSSAILLHHIFALIGMYFVLTGNACLLTIISCFVLDAVGVIGTSMGAHRLWSHRAYKAKTPLKIILMLAQTLGGQNTIWRWVSWHRVHHKFSDTDPDPHNSSRGFFYSHVGWLLTYDHKKFLENERRISMEDMKEEPVVIWQKRNYRWLYPLVSMFLPTFVPSFLWQEDLFVAFCVSSQLRYIISSHKAWSINSVTHMWGYKPYNRNISPVENNIMGVLSWGEGWHNYHHTFPWDYRASETFLVSDWTTGLINLSAKFGQAYDLKSASKTMVEETKAKNKKYL